MNEQRMNEVHEMSEKLKAMGISEADIVKLWGIALETVDKIVKEA